MNKLLTLTMVIGLLIGTISCQRNDLITKQKCRTYFTLSANKQKLTWRHTCPPNVRHWLWAAEKEIFVSQWHKGDHGLLVAEGKDIRNPRCPSNTRPSSKIVGQIVCTSQPDKVTITLSLVPPKDNAYPYRRNGAYELIYE